MRRSDPAKRERLSKTDDGDSGQFRPEHILKSEIAKITDKGGLIDLDGVDRLVQLMQPDSTEKKIDRCSPMSKRIQRILWFPVTNAYAFNPWIPRSRVSYMYESKEKKQRQLRGQKV